MNGGMVEAAIGPVRRKFDVAEQTQRHDGMVSGRTRSGLSSSSFAALSAVLGRSVIDRPFVTPDVFRHRLHAVRHHARFGFGSIANRSESAPFQRLITRNVRFVGCAKVARLE